MGSKYYFKNEKEIMLDLGLQPTKGSGSGWVEKEDGQNEHIICQLKSTNAASIRVKQLDIEKLEHNANVTNKTPMFVIQFLKTHELFILARPMDIPNIAKYIETGVCDNKPTLQIPTEAITMPQNKPKIKSSVKGRQKFWDNKYKEWNR